MTDYSTEALTKIHLRNGFSSTGLCRLILKIQTTQNIWVLIVGEGATHNVSIKKEFIDIVGENTVIELLNTKDETENKKMEILQKMYTFSNGNE